MFREAIRSGDPNMTIPAAEALAKQSNVYRAALDSLSFLDQAIARVDSASDPGAYHVLRKARHALSGNETSLPELELPVKPIDWALLTGFTVEPTVYLQTTKGSIQIRLFPKVAPASVANFIQLVRDGFYDGKYFYRVVPNFVAQGAQSLDYDPENFRIRSELPMVHFDSEGLLGMASSGNHTESTQFFLTHSPTPHLDGKYTLFGRVEKGMDVLHQLQIGDQIKEAVVK
jgi:cyclophilin family peptidyl-prolyl cis-trans isomerase